ncbi:hypothetical protein Moror_14218, partial [Moniliophthora roreri MCA 2997]
MMFFKSALVASLASSACATIFITSPTASDTFTGGQNATIKWQDDGKAPSLKDWGLAKVSIYTGNAKQQVGFCLLFSTTFQHLFTMTSV